MKVTHSILAPFPCQCKPIWRLHTLFWLHFLVIVSPYEGYPLYSGSIVNRIMSLVVTILYLLSRYIWQFNHIQTVHAMPKHVNVYERVISFYIKITSVWLYLFKLLGQLNMREQALQRIFLSVRKSVFVARLSFEKGPVQCKLLVNSSTNIYVFVVTMLWARLRLLWTFTEVRFRDVCNSGWQVFLNHTVQLDLELRGGRYETCFNV